MKKLIFLLFVMLLSSRVLFSSINMTPYLQALTTNSVFVLVECTTADTVIVNYGITSGFGFTAKSGIITPTSGGNTFIHKIKLINLTTNSLYYYQAIQGSSVSSVLNFRTAVLQGSNFRFCVMGDCRSNPTIHGQVASNMLAANPLFSIYTGDYCLDDGYATWKSQYFVTQELDLISKVPFFSVPGNHEAWGPNNKAFVYNPQENSGTQDYYSFDVGDIHFIAINNSVAYTVGSPQYNWALNDLSTTAKRWKIVFFHEPAYSSGGHGSNTTMQSWVNNIFLPKGVDLVLNGHNHFYQRCQANGLNHLVIGGGGASLYTPTSASYVVKSAQSYCYGVFDVTPNSIQMTVYSNTNSVIDTLTLSKLTGIINNNNSVSNSFVLHQNYPNPFNPLTKINFDVPNGNNSNTKLEIYDISGKIVAELVNEILPGGNYSVAFDGSNFSSGTYICKLTAGDFSSVKKITLIK